MRLAFYFDFSCPFAYLGSTAIEAIASRTGADLSWRPMLLGGVLRSVGAEAGLDAEPQVKKRHHEIDRWRWAALRGVPLAAPAEHPQRTVRALRTLLAVDQARWAPFIHAVYRAYWVEGLRINDDDVLGRCLAAAGVTGADAERALAAHQDQAMKDELRRRTDEAVAQGVFGAPTVVIERDQEAGGPLLFFGQDRFDLVEAALGGWDPEAGQAPAGADRPGGADAGGAGPAGDGEPAVVQFWYDFSSPYAYLGSTQIEAMAARTGARLEWRPMLLGGLFKELGTTMVPLLGYSDAKRRYMMHDMHYWASWWQVPFSFNPHFPQRTVTALRLALAAGPRIAPLSHALFRAMWVERKSLEDEAVLAEVLRQSGFDPAAMLARAREPAIKQALIDNSAEAAGAGVFGAPTMVVTRGTGDPQLFWGQDRLGMVERVASGAAL